MCGLSSAHFLKMSRAWAEHGTPIVNSSVNMLSCNEQSLLEGFLFLALLLCSLKREARERQQRCREVDSESKEKENCRFHRAFVRSLRKP